MKQADRLNAQYTVVIGDQELENEVIDVKDMSTGETETINLNNSKLFSRKIINKKENINE